VDRLPVTDRDDGRGRAGQRAGRPTSRRVLHRQAGPLESGSVVAGGLRIHAVWSAGPQAAGRPPLVLVHGLGVSGRYMLPALVRLARQGRVYAPDLPGFGRSDKPARALTVRELADALAAWMSAVGLRQSVLVGHSFGCQVIVDLCLRRPDLVERMVLAAPTGDPRSRSALRHVWRLLLDAPREPLSLIPLAARDYLRAGVVRSARTLRFSLADRMEDKLPSVLVPALVMRGSRDPVVTARWAHEVACALPFGELVTVEGAAHAANYNPPPGSRAPSGDSSAAHRPRAAGRQAKVLNMR
jgi:2-hydroxy-6-oxonona-2,4-dienedioate hydrolase